jgi:hypothetical protein
MDVEPSGVDDAVEVFGDTAVPWLADTDGLRCILYLVDHDSGHSISESIWRDRGHGRQPECRGGEGRGSGISGLRRVSRLGVPRHSVAFSSTRKY